VFEVIGHMQKGALSVSISPKSNMDLIKLVNFYPVGVKTIIPDSDKHKIVSTKEITLDDGTKAVEFEMDWLWEDGKTPLKTTFTIAYKADKLITVSTSSWNPGSSPLLKQINRSFKFY